jgi:ankyrin repeat protein
VKKRIVIAVVLAVLLAASAYAQIRHDLIVAVENGTLEDVRTAISKGADVNARGGENGWTILILAAGGNKNPDVIRTLLKAGADVNAWGEGDGETALMHAARYNDNPEIVLVLLKAGEDAKAKNNNGERALDCAQGNSNLRDTDALKQLEEASK